MLARFFAIAASLLFLSCIPFPSGVLILGDSITSAGLDFPLLSGALPSRAIYNAGMGASTTFTWKEPTVTPNGFELKVWPEIEDVHVVFIHLGVNDSRFTSACQFGYSVCDGNPITPAQYGLNLRSIIQQIDNRRGRTVALRVTNYPLVVLVKPALIDCEAVTCNLNALYANWRIGLYGDEIDAICAENPGVRCGPDLKEVMLPEHYDAGDGVHPNDAGHDAIEQAYLDYLVEEGL